MADRGDDLRRALRDPLLWVAALVSLATTGLAPILIPLEIVEVEGKAVHVGVVMSAVGAGLLTAPRWNRVANRRGGHRELIAAGAGMVALSLAGFTVAHEVHEWAVLAALMGSGAAGVFTVANVLIIAHHPAAEQPSRFGWLQTAATAGTVLGLAAAGATHHTHLGYHVAFATAAAVAIGAAALARWGLPVVVAAAPSPADGAPRGAAARSAPGAPASPGGRPFLVFLLLWLLGNVAQAAVGALYPLLMREDFGLAPSIASYGLAAASAVSTFLFLPASRLVHRLGGLLGLESGFALRFLALGTIWAMAVIGGDAAGGWVFLPFAVYAFAWPLVSVASTVVTARLAADRGSGLYNAAGAGAFLLGPVLGGHVADSYGYDAVWLLGAVGTALALIVGLVLRREKELGGPQGAVAIAEEPAA